MPDTIKTLDEFAALIQGTIGKDLTDVKRDVADIRATMATKVELAAVKADVASVERNLKASIRGMKNRMDANEKNVIGIAGATRELVDLLAEKKVIQAPEAKAIKQRHLGLPA